MTPIRCALLALVGAALVQFSACAGRPSTTASAPDTPSSKPAVLTPALVCVREGETCGPKAECCDGLVCIGTRASFCVSRS